MHRLLACFVATLATPATWAQTFDIVTPPWGTGGFPIHDSSHLQTSPVDPAHIVASSEPGEVYESFDFGATWTTLASDITSFSIDATGALVVCRNVQVSDPSAIERRTASGFVSIPSPASPGAQHLDEVKEVLCHPKDPDCLVVTLRARDNVSFPGYQQHLDSVFLTKDGGATWTMLVQREGWDDFACGDSLVNRHHPTRIVPGDDGDELLLFYLHWSYSGLSGHQLHRFDLETGASVVEFTPILDWYFGGDSPRLRPGRTFVGHGDTPGSGPQGSVLRRDKGGAWVPVNESARFADAVCAHGNPDLVVVDNWMERQLHVTRDGGATWSVLVDIPGRTDIGPESRAVFTIDDRYLFVVYSTGAPSRLEMMRVRLEDPLGTSECSAAPNSSGVPGVLSAAGRIDVSANSLNLRVNEVPAGSFFVPLVSRDTGFLANPRGSDGDLCLGGNIGLDMDAANRATAWGEGHASFDLARLPQQVGTATALAGETWRFQVWYRDPGSPGGTNFTNAVAITWQ